MSNFIIPISSLPSISSLAGQKAAPAANALGGGSFAGILQEAVQNLSQAGSNSQDSMYNLALGASDDLHTGAIDMLKTSAAVSFTSGVTSSILRAYNELMRMSI